MSTSATTGTPRYVALCGGVGGAKLALGLSRVLDAGDLAIIVNTGDDFRHLGLTICPDIDTVLYTLSGLSDRDRGWGRADETWTFMAALAELGGPAWFNLGDRDLATHVLRSEMLAQGQSLTEVTATLARRMGLAHPILPATDRRVGTVLDTDEGPLEMQHYFVERRCEPRVRAIRYEGAAAATPSAEVTAALTHPDLAGVILCPSNPYLSIAPMLAVPGFKELVRQARAPRVAVSPLVGGKSVKGPLGKMMAELGAAPVPQTILDFYGDLVDGLVVDPSDDVTGTDPARIFRCPTLMATEDDKIALARRLLTGILPALA